MELKLYYKTTCPYCAKVLNFINENKIDGIDYQDITKSEEALSQLINIGGKRQVPCLFIDGKPLYESMDIIKWLGENK